MMNVEELQELKGAVLTSVENIDNGEIVFTLETGEKYRLYHSQDCCEYVRIEDVAGDLSDLIGSPILMAEVVTHENEQPPGVTVTESLNESFTWTFYKFATVKGYVTIRWLGESNGYYSTSVEFGPA